jgi:hypothetical protein
MLYRASVLQCLANTSSSTSSFCLLREEILLKTAGEVTGRDELLYDGTRVAQRLRYCGSYAPSDRAVYQQVLRVSLRCAAVLTRAVCLSICLHLGDE